MTNLELKEKKKLLKFILCCWTDRTRHFDYGSQIAAVLIQSINIENKIKMWKGNLSSADGKKRV